MQLAWFGQLGTVTPRGAVGPNGIGLPTVKTGHLSFNICPMAVTLTVNTGLRTVTLPVRQTVPTPVKYALRMDRTGLTIGPPGTRGKYASERGCVPGH